ncbi:PIG-X [Cantharellus anzutake]|uniref:PIG-X n=1 Tax=Cantharellus anzutake TaxID=1750568 RepID=UPI001906B30A|nr:PIG-X [Cantharellus anzutake]KAF8328857.1 PIG-X [Cantharellus anzutake]
MDTARQLSTLANDALASAPHSFFSTSISPTSGFHTESTVFIQHAPSAIPTNHCLFILYILPSAFFFDPYELEQRRQDGDLPPFKVWGETNLELPLEAVDQEGSALLLSLSPDVPSLASVKVPLHVRYMPSVGSNDASMLALRVPWPSVFWVPYKNNCDVSDNINSLNLRNETPVIAVRPSNNEGDLFHTTTVPTANSSYLPIVEYGTFFGVLLAFIYVYISLRAISRRVNGTARARKRKAA